MALSVVVFDVGETLVDEDVGVSASEILYVGDRVDNDVLPALAARLHAVRIHRGSHANVDSPDCTVTIDSLSELPQALAHV
jgi:FMN phosphatase YigB (HAD superfamily)